MSNQLGDPELETQLPLFLNISRFVVVKSNDTLLHIPTQKSHQYRY